MSGSRGLILGSGSRTTPSSYRGAHGEVNIDNVVVYASYVDRIGLRTESSWDEFKTSAEDVVDHAWQIGSTYNANNISSEIAYLQSKDFHKQYLLDLGYTFDLNSDTALVVDGNFHKASGSGKAWDNNSTNNVFDDSATHLNLNAQLNHSSVGVMLSYATTGADKKGALGSLKYAFADNEYGATPSQVSRYVSDFMYDEEQVWQLSAKYNFADLGLPGFDASLTHTRGSGINDHGTDKMTAENETDFIISYAIQEGTFKGASFKAIKAWHTAEYDNKKDVDTEHLRVYLDYTISVF